MSLGALIDHIIATYHRPLPRMLGRLASAARRVGGAALAAQVDELGVLLREHMHREEVLVFPWLRRDNRTAAGVLVNLLEHEHGDVVRQLQELQRLATAHAGAGGRAAGALSAQLRALEVALDEHIHLENHVLFPRALAAGPGSGEPA